MYYVARFFDPYLNRWIQPDPIIPLNKQGVQAWNRYAYINNNPIRFSDQSGHVLCDEEGYCHDYKNGEYRAPIRYGPAPNSINLSVSDPSYDPDLLKQNLKEMADFFGRLAFEPYDWYRTGVDCSNQQCNGWDFLGLLPLIPAGITKYGDDVIEIAVRTEGYHTVPRAVLKWVKDRYPDAYKDVRGKRGAPNVWQIPEEIHDTIHNGRGWGGDYNSAWWKALTELEDVTAQIILNIRDHLADSFGFASWRPK